MESSADEPQNGKELESPEKRSMEESNQSKSVTSESNHSNHSSSKDKDKQSGKRSHSSSSGSPRRRSNAETDGSLSPKKQKRRDENREKSDRNKYQQSSSERGDKIDQKHKKSHQDDKRHSPKRKETGVDRSSSQKHDDIYSPQKGSDKEQSYGEKSSTKGQKLESPDKVSTKGSKQCKSVAFENSHSTSPEVGSPRKKSRFDSSDSKFKKDDSVNLLKQDYSKDKKENFEYFFGKQSPFSNFHTAKFQVDKITYCCSEQYMMHQKAVTFKDGVHAHEIMRATDPVKMKNLGRQVKNFNADYWGRSSERILKKGVKAKNHWANFKQTWHKASLGEGFKSVQMKGHAPFKGEIFTKMQNGVGSFKKPLKNQWTRIVSTEWTSEESLDYNVSSYSGGSGTTRQVMGDWVWCQQHKSSLPYNLEGEEQAWIPTHRSQE